MLMGCKLAKDDLSVTHVSFSKVTVADFGLSAASEVGVTDREVIFPLFVNKVQSASRFLVDQLVMWIPVRTKS